MLTKEDEKLLNRKGISSADFERQMDCFKQGFPFLRLRGAATPGNGIVQTSEADNQRFEQRWENYLAGGAEVVKFVPASGAASRMFKSLFAYLDADCDAPATDFEKRFFADIGHFAFFDELNATCRRNEGMTIAELTAAGRHKAVVRNLLLPEGLNYGQLPKGLLSFHRYADGVRTPMEEHLVEAAQYAATGGVAKVHFTVSNEHRELFRAKVNEVLPDYEARFGVKYDITFSEQKESTDTPAANPDNTPFRNEDGTLLFRPGGHGALIRNLDETEGDVVFIKNIDNIVPDGLKAETTRWKKIIAGVLVDLQEKVFNFVRQLKAGNRNASDLATMLRFLENDLCCHNDAAAKMSETQLTDYLLRKFNRPMRVCGMVRNSGEPGGGPFYAYNADGTVSLQILESSQIDKQNENYCRMFREGTHFNPVDLVCGIRDEEGKPFPLTRFIDPSTGFISSKSKNGRELKALELPGLWNGAMSDWNTIFVEVPAITFNPVKNVNDLLREQHRA
ncbi:DUF4301 family protein [Prevotella brunnea]|uniref:DUF4301 family protein n=1 Tax=Prevotella brunnea TaxID=2508867 RepID=A0A5C8GAC8_9BACT|nr:DUF4301 family protein [Prevotella brunnea]TXJ58922.1 DUF4301 family protein [Prevotella brunnea]